MRFYPHIIISAFIIIISLHSPTIADTFKSTGTIDTYFSPNGGATEAIVKEINNSNTEILMQAFSCTSHPIIAALIDARKRNVKVSIMFRLSRKWTFRPLELRVNQPPLNC